ncbi:hypothetical protein M409DRAFT_49735 [Zasmidium cellare ATCC 36951]|uniref:RBR-type E3 ubiquitin transferase n=1 Tax=Zasmidium cellare ATCC 36951 TaxID=1080233 RepID=A0A6A6D6H4_ZASCE|nr:uncharacterized protein M409DRAFT_49735 [Zasmidium cellare ATCC 36951]KAF2173266.1 hypothetical protein M409DRAFT_49735 [Zasmidium cellare ATCC 36951]
MAYVHDKRSTPASALAALRSAAIHPQLFTTASLRYCHPYAVVFVPLRVLRLRQHFPNCPTRQASCLRTCFDTTLLSILYPYHRLQLPCGGHAYCTECWHTAVELAVTKESNYPIRCGSTACDDLPDQFVIDNLAAQAPAVQTLLNAYREKIQEYKITPQDRTYCANRECILVEGHSQYIDSKIFGFQGQVICPSCGGMTCCSSKALITNEAFHVCGDTKHDEAMREYVESLPEDERWLWKKCPSCGIWVNKVTACNHMECSYCNGEFCLVCGRTWEGPTTCRFGCPKFEAPVYDWEGFNQLGFNPETGLDHYDDNDGDWEEEEEHVFGEDGCDQWGWDVSGYDREGFDADGFNRERINRQGFDLWGFNAAGYDQNGIDRYGRDVNGFDKDGFDVDGFDVNKISLRNLHRGYYDEEGYDPFGMDVFGFSRAGFDVDGYDKYGFSYEGFDSEGYDGRGYNVHGYDIEGYDRDGRKAQGYNRDGFTARHRDADGNIEPGYYKAADGRLYPIIREGPSAKVMECDHHTRHVWTEATCLVCQWTSDLFSRHCGDCGTYLCKQCDRAGVDIQRNVIRERFLWPGSDSYGIAEMFGEEELEQTVEETEAA